MLHTVRKRLEATESLRYKNLAEFVSDIRLACRNWATKVLPQTLCFSALQMTWHFVIKCYLLFSLNQELPRHPRGLMSSLKNAWRTSSQNTLFLRWNLRPLPTRSLDGPFRPVQLECFPVSQNGSKFFVLTVEVVVLNSVTISSNERWRGHVWAALPVLLYMCKYSRFEEGEQSRTLKCVVYLMWKKEKIYRWPVEENIKKESGSWKCFKQFYIQTAEHKNIKPIKLHVCKPGGRCLQGIMKNDTLHLLCFSAWWLHVRVDNVWHKPSWPIVYIFESLNTARPL